MAGISRRDVLGAGVFVSSLSGLVGAASAHASVAEPLADGMAGAQVIDLWPGAVPGQTGASITRRVESHQFGTTPPQRWIYGVARPVMIALRPAKPDGSAALVMPGGGYTFLSYDNEGVEQARWLTARGTTVFILLYRLPGEGWAGRATVPLADAQRAMRLIRARAGEFGVDPARVLALGFSAGGHLAGSLATRHGEAAYAPVDKADSLSARPDLAALLYPVVSLMPGLAHAGSRDQLLGPWAGEAQCRAASVDARVDKETPPLFIAHAADDGTVPVGNALALFQAARSVDRPAELHVFARGGHGFGVRLPATETASAWPQLLEKFAASHGVMHSI